ncbi:hypothetical protein AAEP93_010386 [Penicillium crustosum]
MAVVASDAECLIRECDFPAMKDHPIRLTMFPRSCPETEEEEIRWMANGFRHALEKDSSNYRKVCTDDGTPVGFAGWSLLNRSAARDENSQGGETRVQNPNPETLDMDTISKVSKMFKEEQDRILDGRLDIWCLSVVAVNPAYQRQGIGSMLMRWACDEADKNGRDGYLLASPAGVRLYETFGFKKVGEVRTAKGSLHSMFRKTQN